MNQIPNPMLDVAVRAAKNAGQFLKENLGKVKTIEEKFGQEKNLVTEIDKKSEKIIIDILHEHFPSHRILGEEGIGIGGNSPDYKWVIDPLDGTTNYTHGFPVFSVSIGLEVKGEITIGVIYDPNFNDLFIAEKGKGAYLNGEKLSVSKVSELKKSMLVTGFPYNIRDNPSHAIERFVDFLHISQAVRRMGSAAIDLAYVAAGRYEGFWEVNLQPWDMAAGILLVQEAGGKVTGFAGQKASIYEHEILASNGLVHNQMIEALGRNSI
ncbi:MAG: inositol monophosphatase family protein [Bacteroidota bacterium]